MAAVTLVSRAVVATALLELDSSATWVTAVAWDFASTRKVLPATRKVRAVDCSADSKPVAVAAKLTLLATAAVVVKLSLPVSQTTAAVILVLPSAAARKADCSESWEAAVAADASLENSAIVDMEEVLAVTLAAMASSPNSKELAITHTAVLFHTHQWVPAASDQAQAWLLHTPTRTTPLVALVTSS